MTETVYLALNGKGGTTRKLHTDRDCPCLTSARNVVEKDRDILEPHKEMCLRCTDNLPERDNASFAGRGHREALIDADPDEVGV